MKSIENTEDFVRQAKVRVSTDPQMDRRILDDSFEAMNESTAGSRLSAVRMWQRSRVMRLAAAAVIIVSISLLAIQFSLPPKAPSGTRAVVKSPADMVSVMSLNMAYRRGGIEAVDDLADVAFALPESKPARLSVQEMLTELNGV
jgi:hypothetical protein